MFIFWDAGNLLTQLFWQERIPSRGKRYAMPCAACPWRDALALRLDDFDDLQLQPDLITFNSAISACSTSTAWRMAVVLLQGHSEL